MTGSVSFYDTLISTKNDRHFMTNGEDGWQLRQTQAASLRYIVRSGVIL